MKLFFADSRAGSTGVSNGTVRTATATSVWNIARTAVAPCRSAFAVPAGDTSTSAASFESNRVSHVTSFVVPSLNVATAESGTLSPGRSTLAPGDSSSLRTLGSFLSGPGEPALIQARSSSYSRLPTGNTRPPSCGVRPVALRSSRLSSGRVGSIRRPSSSRVIQR